MGEYSWGSAGGGSGSPGRTAVNVHLGQGLTYTVPAGKLLVVEIHSIGGANITVNGDAIASVQPQANGGTLAANAGDVIGTPNTGTFGLSGFLYDA